ncbi:MAG: esterase/lipase family protein [Pseudobdellovibrionaceae bacterium]
MTYTRFLFRFISTVGFLFFIFFSNLGLAKTIVLVPGYFNSYAPGDSQSPWHKPYWSSDIVDIFTNAGFKVFVVNNLNPVGSIEENGERLLTYLKNVKSSLPVHETFQILAHSAGGLYTLYANNKEILPISKLITINTPFDGLMFVDNLTKDYPGISIIEKYLNLESLNQLRPNMVHGFLQNINKSIQFPIIAYSGHQEKSLRVWNAAYLSPIFYITESLMKEKSDGIVTNTSALGNAGYIQVTAATDYVHLDHWKQVLQAEYFKAMGMFNVEYIRQEQIRFYTSLLQHLN